ncbi:23S rRNA (uracil(1939)-C(5))-methyltransferase RlmD [Pseudidiomarina sp.]|uniref:23S rRNA (uracil(1939)-C(5))-methyltransferase RlmD n=1 Tax=Pseudidiomarina sp. TaxID=2081707 RepID=UPI00299F521E|nr:23S rRNA (uracil(1939)-C(5))-methyltransferase RlmD [Pseudidiomarina sp.]MDX1704900.1 23S rRNA (uracil(1939)-C(5))-methyltransferase RlmD [Pseudidiomarina sp.]
MARIYRPPQRTKAPQPLSRNQQVTGLDHQGRGIVRTDKGVRFVAGALPGELISFQPTAKYEGNLTAIHKESPLRVTPPCRFYSSCGGCDLQHLQLAAQRQHKQQVVSELLQKFAGITAVNWQEPMTAAAWNYRHRTRLAVHWDPKRQQLRLGFRARGSKTIIEIDHCLVLSDQLNPLLAPLRQLLARLKSVRDLGHIELIAAADQRLVLLRLQAAAAAEDHQLLQDFAAQQRVQIWLQEATGEPVRLASKDATEPAAPVYHSAGFELSFTPGNFLQAHAELNQYLVAQAMRWLDPQPGEVILDLFAGSGNFSIPLACTGARVTAVEGVASMVAQLAKNASRAEVELEAVCADLEQPWQHPSLTGQPVAKVLLDPARQGAASAITEIAIRQPQRIIYVSCAPDTLARDTALLIAKGYELRQAQIVDMFPQTHHIETLCWFERR